MSPTPARVLHRSAKAAVEEVKEEGAPQAAGSGEEPTASLTRTICYEDGPGKARRTGVVVFTCVAQHDLGRSVCLSYYNPVNN